MSRIPEFLYSSNGFAKKIAPVISAPSKSRPVLRQLIGTHPHERKLLMFFTFGRNHIRAVQNNKYARRMRDSIHIFKLIVIVRHRFAHFLDVCEIMQSALLGHFAQYARLNILTIFYTARKEP